MRGSASLTLCVAVQWFTFFPQPDPHFTLPPTWGSSLSCTFFYLNDSVHYHVILCFLSSTFPSFLPSRHSFLFCSLSGPLANHELVLHGFHCVMPYVAMLCFSPFFFFFLFSWASHNSSTPSLPFKNACYAMLGLCYILFLVRDAKRLHT